MYSGDAAAARSQLQDCETILKEGEDDRHPVVYGWAHLLVEENEHGPEPALELIRHAGDKAETALIALFAQVPGSAAWVVRVAAACGEAEVSRRAVSLAEYLQAVNPGLPQLALAAGHAHSLLAGDSAGLVHAATEQSHAWAKACAAADLAMSLKERSVADPAESSLWVTLSGREKQVASLVTHGLTNQQIASRISCSPHTVNFHLRNIFRKLGIASRVEISRHLPEKCARPRGPTVRVPELPARSWPQRRPGQGRHRRLGRPRDPQGQGAQRSRPRDR